MSCVHDLQLFDFQTRYFVENELIGHLVKSDLHVVSLLLLLKNRQATTRLACCGLRQRVNVGVRCNEGRKGSIA